MINLTIFLTTKPYFLWTHQGQKHWFFKKTLLWFRSYKNLSTFAVQKFFNFIHTCLIIYFWLGSLQIWILQTKSVRLNMFLYEIRQLFCRQKREIVVICLGFKNTLRGWLLFSSISTRVLSRGLDLLGALTLWRIPWETSWLKKHLCVKFG